MLSTSQLAKFLSVDRFVAPKSPRLIPPNVLKHVTLITIIDFNRIPPKRKTIKYSSRKIGTR